MDRFSEGQRLAILGTVFVCAGLLTLAVAGNPFGGGDAPVAVPREITPPDMEEIEAAAAVESTGPPPHLHTRTPGHLDDIGVEEVEAEQHAPRPSTPTGAPVAQTPAPPPTTAPTTTEPPPTTEAPSTTTEPPPPSTTLPAKKEDDPSPVAVADHYTIAANTIVRLYVLENDSDPDGDIADVTLAVVTEPQHASRFTVSAGYLRYRSLPTDASGFSPTDTLVYEICDIDGNCDTARADITIE